MPSETSDVFVAHRKNMVETQLRRRGILDERVLEAMWRIPRHEFVPKAYESQAYEDHPLPIGEEQTISQPFIVAISLQALELKGTESVLEVGTGSGYQTALLCLLAARVYSVERYGSLAQRAETVMTRLGIGNVALRVGDGSQGWLQNSPYDAMLVSAAAPSAPPSLLEQLADPGRLIIPIGPASAQELQRIRKQNGSFMTETLEGCRFVPLVGAEGY